MFANSLELPNKYTGYAYLLDRNGLVRWRGCGKPRVDELETLYDLAEKLILEN